MATQMHELQSRRKKSVRAGTGDRQFPISKALTGDFCCYFYKIPSRIFNEISTRL